MGGISMCRDLLFLGVCAGEYVGLEEVDDGIADVYFGPLRLGRFMSEKRTSLTLPLKLLNYVAIDQPA